jgi:hypothetical protein
MDVQRHTVDRSHRAETLVDLNEIDETLLSNRARGGRR